MAVYRLVHIDFWQDGFVLDLTPEEKYFYLFLLTNSKTRQCGIYELPYRIMETETGYNRETVDKLISRFEDYGKVVYDRDTKEIILIRWMKHNKINGIKVRKCIEKELKNVKSEKLLKIFLTECERYGYDINFEINNSLNSSSLHNYSNSKLQSYIKMYEDNVGEVDEDANNWLIEISNKIDINVFKEAIEIAINQNIVNKAYINGIINQLKSKSKGENDYGICRVQHRENEYARTYKKEDEYLYSKPTKQDLESARRLSTEI